MVESPALAGQAPHPINAYIDLITYEGLPTSGMIRVAGGTQVF